MSPFSTVFETWQPRKWTQPAAAGRIELAAIFLVPAIWLCQYLWPVVRVEHDGISRRTLWWWDLWPWEAFADGRIQCGLARHCYEFPARPWWRRRLRLELLEETDAQAVNALIRRVWTPPAPEPLPERIQIRLNWPDRRRNVMTSEGIAISKKHRECGYRWDDVRGAIIWRLEPDRPDFHELHLRFSDQELTLRRFLNQSADYMNWSGASAETIAASVCRHVESTRDYSLNGASRNLEEVDARQARNEDQRKRLLSMRSFSFVCAAFLLLVLLFPWPKGVLMAMLYAPLMYAIHWMVRDKKAAFEKRDREYDAERVALLANDNKDEVRRLKDAS